MTARVIPKRRSRQKGPSHWVSSTRRLVTQKRKLATTIASSLEFRDDFPPHVRAFGERQLERLLREIAEMEAALLEAEALQLPVDPRDARRVKKRPLQVST
jgi:hypothetical protein